MLEGREETSQRISTVLPTVASITGLVFTIVAIGFNAEKWTHENITI